MKGLLFGSNAPETGYFVLQKEAARKYAGFGRRSLVSVLAAPWFEVEILLEFRRQDFHPVPSVDVVLLRIGKRAQPLLPHSSRSEYTMFVERGFTAWKKSLRLAYKRTFSNLQWQRLAQVYGFAKGAKPSDLDVKQWIALFKYYQIGVSEVKGV